MKSKNFIFFFSSRFSFSSFQFAKKASAIYEFYDSRAAEFYKNFMIEADGPRIVEKMRPIIDHNINLGFDVIGETYNCVFSVL